MKKRLFLIVIIILILIINTGCTDQLTEKMDEMEKKILKLEQEILGQNSIIFKLEESIVDLSIKNYMMEETSSKKAILDPTSGSGYSLAGDFLVLISNVEEYLDGCKVYLQIGNPNNAVYSGYNINARYGSKPNYSDTSFEYYIWEDSLKKKENKISSKLEKGAWNNVEIILPAIDTKDFSYLEMEILVDSVYLSN